MLLVDPPRLPEGRVGGVLGETVVSGTDAGNELLEGVELSSLAIAAHAAVGLTLPPWLAPVVWSPDGVLLAAGDNGRQRVAALAFEPGQSNLHAAARAPDPRREPRPLGLGLGAGRGDGRCAVRRRSGVRHPHGHARTGRRGGACARSVTRSTVVFDPGRPGLYSVRETGPGDSAKRPRRGQHRRSVAAPAPRRSICSARGSAVAAALP